MPATIGSRAVPMPNWSAIGSGGHGVQFYETDEGLVQLMSNYIGTALVSGGAAIVLATPQHRDGVARRLGDRGFDVEVARAQGRYLAFDAADTLAQFFNGESIDSTTFNELVGAIIDRAIATTPLDEHRVVAFGEMVALLWAAGRIDAAIQLEELWNNLLGRYDLALCCAYPMKFFSDHQDAAPFLRICAQHSHVFPAGEKRQARIRARAKSTV